MRARLLEPTAETKPHLGRPTLSRQMEEEPDEGLALRRSLDGVVARTADASAQAALINRAMASQPSRTQKSLLQLQRQYGNRYVQRVLTLARQADDEEEMALARQTEDQEEVAPDVEGAIQRARGTGLALDSGVRARMEPAFGADFGGVRVHTDSEADTLNQVLRARAFTTGRDIFFRQWEYTPGSSSGRELLAHELTHVVQQGGGRVQHKLSVSQPGDPYEREADRVAGEVMQREHKGIGSEVEAEAEAQPKLNQCKAGRQINGNQRDVVRSTANGPGLQRQTKEEKASEETPLTLGTYRVTPKVGLWFNLDRQPPIRKKKKEPGTRSSKDGSFILPQDEIVEVISFEHPRWYQAMYGGKTGYVDRNYLKEVSDERETVGLREDHRRQPQRIIFEWINRNPEGRFLPFMNKLPRSIQQKVRQWLDSRGYKPEELEERAKRRRLEGILRGKAESWSIETPPIGTTVQWQRYGNHHVQRVLTVARQTDEEQKKEEEPIRTKAANGWVQRQLKVEEGQVGAEKVASAKRDWDLLRTIAGSSLIRALIARGLGFNWFLTLGAAVTGREFWQIANETIIKKFFPFTHRHIKNSLGEAQHLHYSSSSPLSLAVMESQELQDWLPTLRGTTEPLGNRDIRFRSNKDLAGALHDATIFYEIKVQGDENEFKGRVEDDWNFKFSLVPSNWTPFEIFIRMVGNIARISQITGVLKTFEIDVDLEQNGRF